MSKPESVTVEGWVRDPRPTYCMTVYRLRRDAAITGCTPLPCTVTIHPPKQRRPRAQAK